MTRTDQALRLLDEMCEAHTFGKPETFTDREWALRALLTSGEDAREFVKVGEVLSCMDFDPYGFRHEFNADRQIPLLTEVYVRLAGKEKADAI